MRYLLDTGILVRLLHRSDPLNMIIRKAVTRLHVDGHRFVTSTQNIAEFWNLCTRPAEARGGFALSIDQTRKRLRILERFVIVLREPDSAYKNWKAMVVNYKVSGKAVHDTRIAALMKSYRIKNVLTLNTDDFKRFARIKAINPNKIVSG